jgi:hypothetical protein
MSKLTNLALAIALCTTAGLAAADSGDNSMNPFTGESWAALQGGGYNLGQRRPEVTVARAKPATDTAAGVERKVAKARRPIDFGHHAPVIDAADAS